MERYIKKHVEELIENTYYTFLKENNIKLDVVVSYDSNKDELHIFIIDDIHQVSGVVLITSFISVYVLCGGNNIWHEDIDYRIHSSVKKLLKKRVS